MKKKFKKLPVLDIRDKIKKKLPLSISVSQLIDRKNFLCKFPYEIFLEDQLPNYPVYVVSNNIYDKIFGKNKFEFLDKIETFFGLDISDHGIFAMNMDDQYIAYDIIKNDDNDGCTVGYTAFMYKSGNLVIIEHGISKIAKGTREVNLKNYINIDLFDWEMPEKDLYSAEYLSTVIYFVIFKKFSPIETKNIFTNRKNIKKHLINGESNLLGFTYITSQWFTNLERSGAFGVKGHWRLQACGEGMKDRKLIWVKDFVKEGYSRRAQRIIQEDGD